MATKVNVSNLRRCLTEIVDRTASGEERFIICRHGEDVAALVSVEELMLLEDGDKVDLEAALKALKEGGNPIPWEEARKQLEGG